MILTDASYDKETGVSKCTILHNGVKYYGEARLHPDDKDNWSSFLGCRIAEARATLKALKTEKKEKQQELHYYENFVKTLLSYNGVNLESKEYKIIKRIIWKKNKELQSLNGLIKYYEEEIKLLPVKREIVIRAIARRNEQK